MAHVVDSPGEGPEMKDAEDGHFNTKKKRGDADFDVRGLKAFAGFYDARGGEE